MNYEDRAKDLLKSYKMTLNVKDLSEEEETRLIAELSRKLETLDREMATMKVDGGLEDDYSDDEGPGPEPEAYVPYHDISTSEKRALTRYVNFGYEDLNKDLRAGKADSEQVRALDALIAKQQTPEDCLVFRIVENDGLFDGSFTERAFLSTSTDLGYVQSQESNYEDPVILEIHVPAGTPYARTRESWEDDFESEVLFPRGCRLEKTGDLEFNLHV